jgi:hypothetical protein
MLFMEKKSKKKACLKKRELFTLEAGESNCGLLYKCKGKNVIWEGQINTH